jgi:hypothetical protein
MSTRVAPIGAFIVVFLSMTMSGQVQPWNNAGMTQPPARGQGSSAPAPRRDLTGIWDAGFAGISPRGYPTPALTAWGDAKGKTHKSGDGARMVPIEQINDPLSIYGDPGGFPRNLLFELRPFEIIQTPNAVLMFYMWEKRWRKIWTDGRELPKEPDPRWYGYSVGRWEDDSTFVAETVGMDERTWLDNAGNPHSDQMRVVERYRRVSRDSIELTVTIDDSKTYTKPWTPRDKLMLRLLPANMDLMEMIPSASEAAEYRRTFESKK